MGRKFVTLGCLSALLLIGNPMPAKSHGDKCPKGSEEKCCKEYCEDMCSKCRATCLKALNYCIGKGGKHADPEHLRTLMDCVDTCDLNSRLRARNSSLVSKMSAICAETCHRCAKSCEALQDPELADCVKMCKDCAGHCTGASETAK